jgi:multiple antibiotic resistance protein
MMEPFLSAFVTLIVIIDPLGTAAVFAALTQGREPEHVEKIARKATLIAAGVLFFFGLFGATLIKQLGISLEAFRIAGGLLLFVTAFRMLMGHHDQPEIESQTSVYKDHSDISVFPLAIPLLSGPGCMTAMILLTNQSDAWQDKTLVFIAAALALALAYIAMRVVEWVMRTIGASGVQIIARLMGILLAAMAVQFIADGAKAMIGG